MYLQKKKNKSLLFMPNFVVLHQESTNSTGTLSELLWRQILISLNLSKPKIGYQKNTKLRYKHAIIQALSIFLL